ncbi:hypothetical protein SNEBB_010972 [Seison nebaliae]|nr:hypothetical protein SNEBB_010972 [Seison nebaliae]
MVRRRIIRSVKVESAQKTHDEEPHDTDKAKFALFLVAILALLILIITVLSAYQNGTLFRRKKRNSSLQIPPMKLSKKKKNVRWKNKKAGKKVDKENDLSDIAEEDGGENVDAEPSTTDGNVDIEKFTNIYDNDAFEKENQSITTEYATEETEISNKPRPHCNKQEYKRRILKQIDSDQCLAKEDTVHSTAKKISSQLQNAEEELEYVDDFLTNAKQMENDGKIKKTKKSVVELPLHGGMSQSSVNRMRVTKDKINEMVNKKKKLENIVADLKVYQSKNENLSETNFQNALNRMKNENESSNDEKTQYVTFCEKFEDNLFKDLFVRKQGGGGFYSQESSPDDSSPNSILSKNRKFVIGNESMEDIANTSTSVTSISTVNSIDTMILEEKPW